VPILVTVTHLMDESEASAFLVVVLQVIASVVPFVDFLVNGKKAAFNFVI
jgi:hypothetical protein